MPIEAGPGYQDVQLALESVLLRTGDHVGVFYRGDEERNSVLIPVIGEALAVGCGVIYVSDREPPEQVARLLAESIDVKGATERKQLHLAASTDAYLADGYFDPDRVVGYYHRACEGSTGCGFPVVCVIGEMSWSIRECPGTERLLEYEALYAVHFGDTQAITLCLYDLDQIRGEQMFDLLRLHTRVLLNGIEIQNPSRVDPGFFLPGTGIAR
jgi:MEDS: MEthanogen/methylotroph, DcmR Sensory domain